MEETEGGWVKCPGCGLSRYTKGAKRPEVKPEAGEAPEKVEEEEEVLE